MRDLSRHGEDGGEAADAREQTSFLRAAAISFGVLFAAEGSGDAAVAATHDVAVHIAAYSPTYLTREDVPAELVESERRIADETARAEGKPEAALTKIVEGRLTGFFKEIVLVDQAFAKDAKKSVGQVAKEAGAEVTGFARFKVGV